MITSLSYFSKMSVDGAPCGHDLEFAADMALGRLSLQLPEFARAQWGFVTACHFWYSAVRIFFIRASNDSNLMKGLT